MATANWLTHMSTTGGTTGSSVFTNNIISSTSTPTSWVDNSTFTDNNFFMHDKRISSVRTIRLPILTRRERILITALPSAAMLQGPSCPVADHTLKHMIDEVVDRLTSDGVDVMNQLTKKINYLDLNEVNFVGMLRLKDDSIIRIHDDGNYDIMDGFAKIVYKGNRIREFNKFIEGSSLLEDFIKDCGKIGIRQSEFMSIPIEVFIHWLIYKAALKDDDPLPEGVFEPENHPKTKSMKLPRCLACGKFISPAFVEVGINFCNEYCLLIMRNRKAPLLRLGRQNS